MLFKGNVFENIDENLYLESLLRIILQIKKSYSILPSFSSVILSRFNSSSFLKTLIRIFFCWTFNFFNRNICLMKHKVNVLFTVNIWEIIIVKTDVERLFYHYINCFKINYVFYHKKKTFFISNLDKKNFIVWFSNVIILCVFIWLKQIQIFKTHNYFNLTMWTISIWHFINMSFV